MAAPDLAGENAFAGLVADIGLDQIAGGASQSPYFRHACQRCDHGLERGELIWRKALGLSRRPRRYMDRAVAESERKGHIVGSALGLEFSQDRNIRTAI